MNVSAHLQPREEADVHEGVHVLQVFVDVQSGDKSCGETEAAISLCNNGAEVLRSHI